MSSKKINLLHLLSRQKFLSHGADRKESLLAADCVLGDISNCSDGTTYSVIVPSIALRGHQSPRSPGTGSLLYILVDEHLRQVRVNAFTFSVKVKVVGPRDAGLKGDPRPG